ncbi:MAG: ABC transporter ATP-binding protein [Acholeplasmataceae bacterium]|jgi:oligopeptide/dipeptide ABC transporter ATP-binding protein
MLELKNVGMSFDVKGKLFKREKKAVVIRDFSLTIGDSEIIAIVGESGCGKTTIGKIITGLLKPTSGELFFEGINIRQEAKKSRSNYRRNVQFIQQDSYAALNPVKTIYQSLCAALETHNPKISKEKTNSRIEELMSFVGLTPTAQYLFKYPHQLSGGQRQRVLMARALAMEPKLIVADEPVSMIDVSLRISILNLISKLNEKLNIAFIYITHDLATAKYIAQNGRICVMYLGDIVELGSVNDILFSPKHPYTQALITAIPIPDPKLASSHKEIPIKGMEMTKLTERDEGCPFAPRCPYATDKCLKGNIEYVEVDNTLVKCCNLNEVPKWEI